MQKRIFLKLSGQALEGDQGYGIDNGYLFELGQKILTLQNKGYQIALMTGAGNIFRGKNEGKGIDPAIGHYAGMMATMINALVFADILKQLGAKVSVFCAIEMPRFIRTINKIEALQKIESGEVVICAGGTGNPFCTTDLGAVIRGLELDCEIVVKCTRVNGVYDADPEKDPQAKKYDEISMEKALDDDLNIMDHSAMAMARENGMPIYVCHIDDIHQRGTKDLQGTKVFI